MTLPRNPTPSRARTFEPVVLFARCIADHKWQMTPEQISEACVIGCAMCPTCGQPATVERASIPAPPRRRAKRKGKKR